MEAVKRTRKCVRTSLTKTMNCILEELSKEKCDKEIILTRKATIERLFTELDVLDKRILNDEFHSDEAFELELANIEEYREKMDLVRNEVDEFLNSEVLPLNFAESIASSLYSSRRQQNIRKIELKQFGEEAKAQRLTQELAQMSNDFKKRMAQKEEEF